MMDKVQKHNSFNTNTPSSESYRNHVLSGISYECQTWYLTLSKSKKEWRYLHTKRAHENVWS